MIEKNLEFTQSVKETAKLIDLSILPKYLSGVVDNFEKIKAI